ncbi:hypothetical protein DLJ59_06720 [Micromonospora inaquosa]|uniref:Uncharacterized protein n=1 Tax=Micromonospora inaquosa TaxID=2203716 RepID=A0A3N9WYH0_9ACTN|nr:hypothetical protein DLJ59_06720 [Micromonospora inaquosa]
MMLAAARGFAPSALIGAGRAAVRRAVHDRDPGDVGRIAEIRQGHLPATASTRADRHLRVRRRERGVSGAVDADGG